MCPRYIPRRSGIKVRRRARRNLNFGTSWSVAPTNVSLLAGWVFFVPRCECPPGPQAAARSPQRLGFFFARTATARKLPLRVLSKTRRRRLVTAYLMTNAVQNNKVLLYKGDLAEFFQKKEGQFEYVVLMAAMVIL
jgi:hypothetical protein